MNSFRAVLVRVAEVLTIATAVGCASHDSPSQTSKTIESLSGMKSSVANSAAQVDRLISAMNSLSTGNDLPNAYSAFEAEVIALRESGDRAAARARSLQSKENEYIAQWQKELGAADNAAEKVALDQRKEMVRSNYESAKVAGQSVRQAYGPLNAKLTDIQRTLAGNVTPARVAEIRPVLDQARREAQELRNRLANFASALDRMQSGLSQPSFR
jgi:hypothetical protein